MDVTHTLHLDLSVELRPENIDPPGPPTAVLLVGHREVAVTTVAPIRLGMTSADDVLAQELPGLMRRWLGVESR